MTKKLLKKNIGSTTINKTKTGAKKKKDELNNSFDNTKIYTQKARKDINNNVNQLKTQTKQNINIYIQRLH